MTAVQHIYTLCYELSTIERDVRLKFSSLVLHPGAGTSDVTVRLVTALKKKIPSSHVLYAPQSILTKLTV